MGRRAGIAALMTTFLLSACSAAGSADNAAGAATPLPSGVTLTCTDRGQDSGYMGPLQNGKYIHYLCRDGKVTSWWLDDNDTTEDAPPG